MSIPHAFAPRLDWFQGLWATRLDEMCFSSATLDSPQFFNTPESASLALLDLGGLMMACRRKSEGIAAGMNRPGLRGWDMHCGS